MLSFKRNFLALNSFLRQIVYFTSGSESVGNRTSEENRKSYKYHILSEAELSQDHLTPELKLHLITQNCRLWKAHPEKSPFLEPFWAFYWPGGQAVTRYILDNKSLVSGKKILDFGAGCGASGLAARALGATEVTFNDIDPVACESILLNGEENKIKVDCLLTENLIGSFCETFDTVLVGDMLYDTEFADEVLKWLRRLHERGTFVLIGDPGRFALESHPLKPNLRCLAKYELRSSTILENSGHPQAFVWTFDL